MPEQKIFQDPSLNAYQVGIAYRLKVEPQRVNVIIRVNPKGGIFIDVAVDGRDLTAAEQRIVTEYFENELQGIRPSVVGERDINEV